MEVGSSTSVVQWEWLWNIFCLHVTFSLEIRFHSLDSPWERMDILWSQVLPGGHCHCWDGQLTWLVGLNSYSWGSLIHRPTFVASNTIQKKMRSPLSTIMAVRVWWLCLPMQRLHSRDQNLSKLFVERKLKSVFVIFTILCILNCSCIDLWLSTFACSVLVMETRIMKMTREHPSSCSL